jgi:hypothetical protein
MKLRVPLIAFIIVALTVFSSVPSTKAEPLTIMAIAGIVAVLSASSVDMIDRSEDNKDQHAQLDETATMHAKAEASGAISGPEEAVVTPN